MKKYVLFLDTCFESNVLVDDNIQLDESDFNSDGSIKSSTIEVLKSELWDNCSLVFDDDGGEIE